jgi:hypothetical protein
MAAEASVASTNVTLFVKDVVPGITDGRERSYSILKVDDEFEGTFPINCTATPCVCKIYIDTQSDKVRRVRLTISSSSMVPATGQVAGSPLVIFDTWFPYTTDRRVLYDSDNLKLSVQLTEISK